MADEDEDQFYDPFDHVGRFCFQQCDHMPGALSPTILVGSVRHAASIQLLRRLGVTHVLNVAAGECEDPVAEYQKNGISYYGVEGFDRKGYPMLEQHLQSCLSYLVPVLCCQAGAGRALVHCAAGRNRSATIAVAAVMLHERAPLSMLVRRLMRRRPIVLTNPSFRDQLVTLATSHGLHRESDSEPIAESEPRECMCANCSQPHAVPARARIDFQVTLDCRQCTVAALAHAIASALGTSHVRIDVDCELLPGFLPPRPDDGKPSALLGPQSFELPIVPFGELTIAELPVTPPIGTRSSPNDPLAVLLIVLDLERRTLATFGLMHVASAAAALQIRAR